MTRMTTKRFAAGFALVTCLAACNLFRGLGTERVSGFDEARHGVTAFEMLSSREFILTTYRGHADYWNLKPPLGAWLVALSFRCFGCTPFALRLPAAASAFGCVLMVMLVLRLRGMPLAGLIAGLILASNSRFVGWHAGRTGDYDAQLAFLICIAMLSIEHARHVTLKCVVLGLAMACSFLLKSFAAIYTIGLVGAGVIILLARRTLRWHHLVVIALCAAVPVLAWAVLRYRHDGLEFFRTMVAYDLLKRSTVQIEGHVGGYDYYLVKIVVELGWLTALCMVGFIARDRFRPLSIRSVGRYPFYLLWVAVPLLIASLVKSKSSWYINPAYPGLAVLLGIGFASVLEEPLMPRLCRIVFGACLVAALLFSECRLWLKIFPSEPSKLQSLIVSLGARSTSNTVLYSSFWVPAPHPMEKSDKLYDWNQAAVFAAEAMARLRVADCPTVSVFIAQASLDDLLIENTNTVAISCPGVLDVVTSSPPYVVWRKVTGREPKP